MNKPTLYLMVGYPGAGKTTVSKIIHDLTGAEHVWADRERHEIYGTPTYSHAENLQLYARLNDETEQLLRSGKSVIYDTAFNFFDDRKRLRQVADRTHAETIIVWVKVDKSLALTRATDNAHLQHTRVLGDMPLDIFDHIASKLEAPGQEENVVILDGTKITPDYVKSQLGL
jgi:predicted kinase